MANPNQTPSLPSTADPNPYVPISWMAVSALLVSAIFLIVLIGLALWDFFKEKEAFAHPRALDFPVGGRRSQLCRAENDQKTPRGRGRVKVS